MRDLNIEEFVQFEIFHTQWTSEEREHPQTQRLVTESEKLRLAIEEEIEFIEQMAHSMDKRGLLDDFYSDDGGLLDPYWGDGEVFKF